MRGAQLHHPGKKIPFVERSYRRIFSGFKKFSSLEQFKRNVKCALFDHEFDKTYEISVLDTRTLDLHIMCRRCGKVFHFALFNNDLFFKIAGHIQRFEELRDEVLRVSGTYVVKVKNEKNVQV